MALESSSAHENTKRVIELQLQYQNGHKICGQKASKVDRILKPCFIAVPFTAHVLCIHIRR